MRQVDGGVFLNEPSVERIVDTLRRIYYDGVAKECGAKLTGVAITRKDANGAEDEKKPVRQTPLA